MANCKRSKYKMLILNKLFVLSLLTPVEWNVEIVLNFAIAWLSMQTGLFRKIFILWKFMKTIESSERLALESLTFNDLTRKHFFLQMNN